MATGNMYRKFHEVRTSGFCDIQARRQPDIQTRRSQYFAPFVGAN